MAYTRRNTTDGVTVMNKDLYDNLQDGIENKPFYYDSVADMKADPNLKEGMKAVTLGYYSPNDGGGATYLIQKTENNYAGISVRLNSNLYASILIKKGSYINVLKAGVKNDGVTPVSDLLNTLLTNLSFNKLYFPSGIYLLDKKLECKGSIEQSLIGESTQNENYYNTGRNNNTIFTRTQDYKDSCLVKVSDYTRVSIRNIMFYGDSYRISCDDQISTKGNIHNMYSTEILLSGLSGVIVDGAQSFIDNCFFEGFSDVGLNLKIYNKVNDCNFKNCRVGLLASTDNIIGDLIIMSCETGVILGAGENEESTSLSKSKGSSNILSNVRIDGCSGFGVKIYGWNNILTNYLSDQINYASILLCGSRNCISNANISRSAQYTAGNEMPADSPEPEKYCAFYFKGDCGSNQVDFVIAYMAANDTNNPDSKTPSFAICSDGYLNNNYINIVTEGGEYFSEISKIIHSKKVVNSVLASNGIKYELVNYLNNSNYVTNGLSKSKNVRVRSGLFFEESDGSISVYNKKSDIWTKI
jgi:hypothetical protein